LAYVIDIEGGEIQQSGEVVLKAVNLKVEENEFVYLIGKTGSGKSSLLKMLYGELGLSAGEANIAGFDEKIFPN
jgi:cell division transport system ATP-binding protein